MPLGKDTAIALRKERLAYQLEDAIGETEANKSKKRTTLSSTEMFVDLDLVVSYWQISSVHFSACSIVLLPRPLHAPCCTTAS